MLLGCGEFLVCMGIVLWGGGQALSWWSEPEGVCFNSGDDQDSERAYVAILQLLEKELTARKGTMLANEITRVFSSSTRLSNAIPLYRSSIRTSPEKLYLRSTYNLCLTSWIQ